MPGDKRAPRVTVVIPTFNRASLLRESIESVLAQSFTDFELLVADNGSTDDTPRLVASIEDPRVGADRLETNIGMIGNLDRSLRMGTGPYLVVLHDDDLLHPRHLETTVAALDARPEVAFVHTAISFIDGDGRVTRERMAWGLPIDPFESSETFIRRVFTAGSRVSPSGTIVRRTALHDIRYDPDDKAANDMGLWLRIARHGEVAFVDQPLVAIRRHAASLTIASGVREMAQDDEYEATFETVEQMRIVMDRFADRFGGDPVPRWRLRALARKSSRSQLAGVIRHRAGTPPRRRDLAGLFVEASRIEPTLALSADGVELLATMVGGERAAALVHRVRPRLRSARARLRGSDEQPAGEQ